MRYNCVQRETNRIVKPKTVCVCVSVCVCVCALCPADFSRREDRVPEFKPWPARRNHTASKGVGTQPSETQPIKLWKQRSTHCKTIRNLIDEITK